MLCFIYVYYSNHEMDNRISFKKEFQNPNNSIFLQTHPKRLMEILLTFDQFSKTAPSKYIYVNPA